MIITKNYVWKYAKETYPDFYKKGLLEQELESIEACIEEDAEDLTAEEMKAEIEERVDNAFSLVSDFVRHNKWFEYEERTYTFTKEEKNTVYAVLNELMRKPSEEVIQMVGSVTYDRLATLCTKLCYWDWCKDHRIEFEDMTSADWDRLYSDLYEG